MKQRKILYLCFFLLLAISTTGFTYNFKAVYLKPRIGGQISENELKKYPEILVVNSYKKLKSSVNKKVAIWIDKDALKMVDDRMKCNNWLWQRPQNSYPILLIGYNDSLYSFTEQLSVFLIIPPHIDWSKTKLEPGFSVCKIIKRNKKSISYFMKGYKEHPRTKSILSITNMLLENKFPIDSSVENEFPK